MAISKKKVSVEENLNLQNDSDLDTVSQSDEVTPSTDTKEITVVSDQTDGSPDWESLRHAIYASNWDTTLSSGDLQVVWETAVQSGADGVASIPWLGSKNLYVDLVSNFLKK